MTRVVLDTNVLISGVYDELSASTRILDDVLHGQLVAFVSSPLLREYQRLIHREVRDETYKVRLEKFFGVAEPVSLSDIQAVVEEDPEDDKVLATAVAAHAEALVTSDQHLRRMDPYGDIRILTPQEFLNRRNDSDGSWKNFARTIGLG